MVAGQLQAHVVLGQEDVGGFGEDGRFVMRQPEKLGGGQAGHGGDAGDLAEVGDGGFKGLALGGGAAVVPQDRGAQGAVGRVQQDGAMHLAGEADCGGPGEGLRGGLPESGGGLLVAFHQRSGCCSDHRGCGRVVVSGTVADARGRLCFVHQYRFDGGRADIDAEKGAGHAGTSWRAKWA